MKDACHNPIVLSAFKVVKQTLHHKIGYGLGYEDILPHEKWRRGRSKGGEEGRETKD